MPRSWLSARQAGEVAYWCGIATILLYLGQDFLLGGHPYKQGDWLINVEQAFVRRGLLGSAFIRVSDLLQVDLLLLVVLSQAALLMLFAVALFRVMRAAHQQPLFWLLLLSPAFTWLFWANDPQGSLRKELLVYAAFALLLVGIIDRRRLNFAAAVALFAMGMLGHEANVLFLPAFIWLLYRLRQAGLLTARESVIALTVLAAVATVSAIFFVRHVSLVAATPVCAPLLLRGFDGAFCEGAIGWVTRDPAYALQVTAGNWSINSWGLGIVYLWTTGIALWFASHFTQRRRLQLIYAATALPFLPLFIVALDWGRWMNFHVSSWVFLMLAEQLLGGLAQARARDDKMLLAVIVSILPLAPSHMTYLVLPRAVLLIAGVLLLHVLVTAVMRAMAELVARRASR